MSDKSDAKQFQRVINKLLPEINASRQGQQVIISNILSCIKILNNTIPIPEWRFKAPSRLTVVEPLDDSAGGNA